MVELPSQEKKAHGTPTRGDMTPGWWMKTTANRQGPTIQRMRQYLAPMWESQVMSHALKQASNLSVRMRSLGHGAIVTLGVFRW